MSKKVTNLQNKRDLALGYSPEQNIIPLNPIHVIPMTNPYISAATSDNTRRAYQSDIAHFEIQWGGKLPATADSILRYLQTFATTLNPRTLSRRITALKNWHVYHELPDPTQHPAISKTLSGIMRTHGKPKEKAPPLLPEHLIKIVTHLSQQPELRAARDNALLQLGFFGALRRSELVSMCVEHLQWQTQGIEILIPHSKTDQHHEGQFCAIPFGNEQLCPVRALKNWLNYSNISSGFIFRRIGRDNYLYDTALSTLSVNQILKKVAKQASIPSSETLSSHSMRRGLATSASRDGASLAAIMRQGRWKQVNTVMEYIEAVQRFEENAANHILKKMQSEKSEDD